MIRPRRVQNAPAKPPAPPRPRAAPRLAERDSLNLVLQSREATASSSRRRLDAAAQDADQQAALGRLLKKRCEDAEEAATAAKSDRDRVEAARKNLERVVRSFEQKASDAESNLKRDHALQISALEGDVEDAQQQIRELEASLKAARAGAGARRRGRAPGGGVPGRARGGASRLCGRRRAQGRFVEAAGPGPRRRARARRRFQNRGGASPRGSTTGRRGAERLLDCATTSFARGEGTPPARRPERPLALG